MDIHNQLLKVFPNTINKESEVFGAIVANSSKTGTFEKILNEVKDFISQWTGTPNLYKQSGEMLELTAAFFSYFERYTDESDEAFLNRIKIILMRNGDTKWGNPFDTKNVFKAYFPHANIFLVENTNNEDDNLLNDGDFQDKSESWNGIDNDQSSNCHYSKAARFSKTYGCEMKSGGELSQQIINDNSDSSYSVILGDTYSSIAKKKYGNELLASYISSYGDNPLSISGPIKGTCNVRFSRKIALESEITIPCGTIISNGDLKYLTTADAVIKADSSATKATGYVIFSRAAELDTDSEIPSGTKVTDGTYIYETVNDAILRAGTVNSDPVEIIAEDYGSDYNIAANKIITILSSISEDITKVTNPNALTNGFNGNELNSNLVQVQAQLSGKLYNIAENEINTIETKLDETLSVTNTSAVTNGYDGDEIKIPSRNTYFLHFFLNGKCEVQIIDNNGRYWNNSHYFDKENAKWIDGYWQTEENSIEFDTVTGYESEGSKATADVRFYTSIIRNEDITIPVGTRVSDGTHTFVTLVKGIIEAGQTETVNIEVEAIKSGWEYNVDTNTITTIIDTIKNVESVTNVNAATGGTNSEFRPEKCYFITDDTVTSITVKFIATDNLYLDYIRLFKKQFYPSFTIIAQFQSYVGVDAAALYPGSEDPEILPSHENASYFDNDYFTGLALGNFSKDIYTDILNYVKSVGVKAYIEIVNRDEV